MNVHIVLDPSSENIVAGGYTVVETELEFLRFDGNTDKLWISGQALCRWANNLYRVRGASPGLVIEELSSPRDRLRALIGTKADEMEIGFITRCTDVLLRSPNASLGELLSVISGGKEIWLKSPSVEHAAEWLQTPVQTDLLPLADVQRQMWARSCGRDELKPIYETPYEARERVLKEWFLPESGIHPLGPFPVRVSGSAEELLGDEWGRRLRETRGGAAENIPVTSLNISLLASVAYEYFSHNPELLKPSIIARLSPGLGAAEKARLERLVPKSQPQVLPVDAGVDEAISWVVDEYLPYRQWQVDAKPEGLDEIETLGDSFADWLLRSYPKLVTHSREESALNVRGRYLVESLAKQSAVLWVVVDGLNYLNHKLLLRLLGQSKAELGVSEDMTLLTVLPTITEKAKYGLTSGLFPRENIKHDWNIQKVFQAEFPDGIYAGENQVDRLHSALADARARVCYWNMTAIDDAYHKQTDPSAITANINNRLKALAEVISDLVMGSPHRDRMAIVISTDHGQMIGPCVDLSVPKGAEKSHGRTAYGGLFEWDGEAHHPYTKSHDGSMVVLNPIGFFLDEPTTIALKSFYFGGWTKDSRGRAWGVHGGLYPEEVVVGLSVLRRWPERKPITARVTGTGEVGKPGVITLHVDNPNTATLSELTLTLNQVEDYANGQPLLTSVRQHVADEIKLNVLKFPPPDEGETLVVSGRLVYEFDDGMLHECAVTGTLTCKQMYSGHRPSLKDRFKR
jgi:hypothetical protein